MPRITVAPHTPALAADFNAVSDQTVMVFATAAQRTAAIPTPVEGMHTYRADVDSVEMWNGAAWTSGTVHFTMDYTAVESGDIAATPVAVKQATVPVVAGVLYDIRGVLHIVARVAGTLGGRSRLLAGSTVINNYDAYIPAANIDINAGVNGVWRATTSGSVTFTLDLARSGWATQPVRFTRGAEAPNGLVVRHVGPG